MKTNKSLFFNTGNIVLALDLDYTLAHYKDEMRGLFALTCNIGISEEIARSALHATEEIGFSLSKFYKILSQKTHVYVCEEKFLKLAQSWFRENYVLYDDAHAFLLKYLERVPIVIVTAGDEEFQREKIKLLDFFPNKIIVVPVGFSKIDALKSVWEEYEKTVVFVDDNPKDFGRISVDAWFGLASYRVRMLRSGSPFEKEAEQWNHMAVTSFDELRSLIPFEKEAV